MGRSSSVGVGSGPLFPEARDPLFQVGRVRDECARDALDGRGGLLAFGGGFGYGGGRYRGPGIGIGGILIIVLIVLLLVGAL